MKVETFEPLLNQKFIIRFSEEHTYEFELIEVKRLKKIEEIGKESYTIYFRGDKELPIFRQGTYKVEKEEIGSIDLFLIPRQPDEHGIYYEHINN